MYVYLDKVSIHPCISLTIKKFTSAYRHLAQFSPPEPEPGDRPADRRARRLSLHHPTPRLGHARRLPLPHGQGSGRYGDVGSVLVRENSSNHDFRMHRTSRLLEFRAIRNQKFQDNSMWKCAFEKKKS